MDVREVVRRLGLGRRGPALEEEVDEELRFHLEEMESLLVEEGMEPGAARREARRRFGDVDATRAYCTDQQLRLGRREGIMRWLGELRQDLGYAVRGLRRAPGYAGVVVTTLALGIAAATVVMSLMNPYFFRPLPYERPGELVQLGQVDPRFGWDGARFSLGMLQDYRDGSRSLTGIEAYRYGTRNVTGDEGAERVQTGVLTGGMFRLLGVDAVRGRTFSPEEAGPGGRDVVVLDHGLWQRRWGGDPAVVGRTVELDGTPYEVVGIMPPDFSFPFNGIKLWVPGREDPMAEPRGRTAWIPVARLAPGWSREEAARELEVLQASLAERWPDADGLYAGVSVKGLREALNFAWEILKASFGILLVAVLGVLAIACVNVASLTLARAGSRAREMAIRASLGAGRGRVLRQLLTESAVLAVLGGTLGVGLAHLVVTAVGPLLPEDLFRVGEATVDGMVLAFALAVTLATPVLFGLVPALTATRQGLDRVLREGGTGDGRRSLRARRALVVTEIALAVLLVTATGLTLRSLIALQEVELGYDSARILTVELTPPEERTPDAAAADAWFAGLKESLVALPGVEGAGDVYPLPMNHESIPVELAVPGDEPAEGEVRPTALQLRIGEGTLDAMGIRVLAGTGLAAGGAGPGGDEAILVSRSLARRTFGDDDPVGRSLLLGPAPGTPTRIVGVVDDIVHTGFDREGPDHHVYRTVEGSGLRRRFLTLRTAGPPEGLIGPVRDLLRREAPEAPGMIRPMPHIVRESTLQWALGAAGLGVFGMVALGLAALGVYGLVVYSVSLRRREMGIRMALGAGAGTIRRLVLGEALLLAGAGAGMGILLAVGAGTLLSGFLYGVGPADPPTLAGVVLLFAGITLVASVLPAFRAGRTDPAEVLRAD